MTNKVMLIKKNKTKVYKNSPTCTVWEPNHPTDNLSYTTMLVNGRWPEIKRRANLECEEIIFVISGSGTIHTEKGDFKVEAGDSYYLEIKEKHFIEGDNLWLGLTNAPKWTFEQYREVE